MAILNIITKRFSGNGPTTPATPPPPPPQEVKSFTERLGDVLKPEAGKFQELRALAKLIEDAEYKAKRIVDRIYEARNDEAETIRIVRRTLDMESFERAVAASMRRAAVEKVIEGGWETSLTNGFAPLSLVITDPQAASETVRQALKLVIQRVETETERIEAEEIAAAKAAGVDEFAPSETLHEWKDYSEHLQSKLKSADNTSRGDSYFGPEQSRPWVLLKTMVKEILESLPQ